MTFDEVKNNIEEHINMLPSRNIKIHEAEETASKFLILMHTISVCKLSLEEQRAEFQSLLDVIYRDEIFNSQVKGVTEKKIDANASKDYRDIRELLEVINAKLDFLKANYRIFENGHIHMRMIAKGGDSNV
jgi:hypothetical protein